MNDHPTDTPPQSENAPSTIPDSETGPPLHLQPERRTAPGPGFAPATVPPARGRFALYAVGLLLMAFGLRGIVTDANGWTQPWVWVPLVAAAAVAHDLLLVPVVFAVAVPLARLLPARLRRYLVTGMALSAVAFAVSWPGLRGYGRTPDNPSILPLDYAHGLRVALVVLWLALLALFLLRSLIRAVQANSRARLTPVTSESTPVRPTSAPLKDYR